MMESGLGRPRPPLRLVSEKRPGRNFRALLREMLRDRLASRTAEASSSAKSLKILVSALGLEPRTY